jgi:hypothetical protein
MDFLRRCNLSNDPLFEPNPLDTQLHVGGHTSIERSEIILSHYLARRLGVAVRREKLNSEVTMCSQRTNAQLTACRRLAMERNEKLFEEANALNRSAIDLLERPDLDNEMFLQYLQIRGKAETLFREALDHLNLINEQFPTLSNESETLFEVRTIEPTAFSCRPAVQAR